MNHFDYKIDLIWPFWGNYAAKWVKDYQGALQTDGYAAYSIFEEKQGVLPLGCMAHVRRKFETALTTTPEAQKALDYIALLYMLEGNLKEEGADYEQIRKEREQKAYPILQQMESWMKETFKVAPQKAPWVKPLAMLLACGLVSVAIAKKGIFI